MHSSGNPSIGNLVLIYIYIYGFNLRTLAFAAVGGEGGVARADVVVASGARRDTVATLAACPTSPLAQPRPRRQTTPCSARATAVCTFNDRHAYIN